MFVSEPEDKGYSVLIVDDDEFSRKNTRAVIGEILGQRGQVQVEEAGSVAEAISVVTRLHAEHHLPDLMMVDLWMPDKGGLDLLKWMRGAQPFPEIRSIPTIATTAADNPDLDVASGKLAAVGIVHSLDVSELERLIDLALPLRT